MDERGGTARNEATATIVRELYEHLARRFPVSCASDEFIFFPQVLAGGAGTATWDDYSPESVQETVRALGRMEDRLAKATAADATLDETEAATIRTITRMVRTLAEQLDKVGVHREQPTYHLTLATAGILEAAEGGREEVFRRRMESLPAFFANSLAALSGGRIPELFVRQGLEMARHLSGWLAGFTGAAAVSEAVRAVSAFSGKLSSLRTRPIYLLDPDHLERVVYLHMGTAMFLGEILETLDEERAAMLEILGQEASRLGYNGNWQAAFTDIPRVGLGENGRAGALAGEIERLRRHCIGSGFLAEDEITGRLDITELPSSLAAVRAADSYNARPGHPFAGGTFFIYGGGTLGRAGRDIHPVYRMTAAHETWPGHHLLDLFRWNNPDPRRRPLEFPLFYEGWACFSEDLMLETGAFDQPFDRLILARRRYRHAVRGSTDLLLHAGRITEGQAAARLADAGFDRARAADTVRKYALRPGYQLCYTLGRRRFHSLLKTSGMGIPRFVRAVLKEGEIGFGDLEKALAPENEEQRAKHEG